MTITGPPHPESMFRWSLHKLLPGKLGHPLPVISVPQLKGQKHLRFGDDPQINPPGSLRPRDHSDPKFSPAGDARPEPIGGVGAVMDEKCLVRCDHNIPPPVAPFIYFVI